MTQPSPSGRATLLAFLSTRGPLFPFRAGVAFIVDFLAFHQSTAAPAHILHAVNLIDLTQGRQFIGVARFVSLTFPMVGRAGSVVEACVTAACILLEVVWT